MEGRSQKKRKAKDHRPRRKVQVTNTKKATVTSKSSSSDFDFDEERNRTPSGSILTPKVKQITNFFQPKVDKKSSEGAVFKGHSSQQNRRPVSHRIAKHVNRKIASTVNSRSLCSASVRTCKNNNNKTGTDCENTDNSWIEDSSESETEGYFTPNTDQRSLKSPDREFLYKLSTLLKEATEEDLFKNKNMSEQVSEIANTSSDDQRSENRCDAVQANKTGTEHEAIVNETLDNEEMEVNTDKNPQALAIASVLEMLKEIKRDFRAEIGKVRDEDIAVFKSELKNCKAVNKEEVKTQVKAEIKTVLKDEIKAVETMKEEVAYWKRKSQVLTDICDRMNVEIADLTSRVENLELNNSKAMCIITGLRLQSNIKYKQDCAYELEDFFEQTLNLKVGVNDCFMINTASTPPPLVVTFQTNEDKRLVMQAKKRFKDLQETLGGKIFINEYLPPHAQEKRRRDQDVIQMSYPDSPEDEFNVEYTKEGLTVQGQVYKKQILPPTPKQLISLSKEELDRIFNMPCIRGPDLQLDRSVFTAYSATVDTLDDIKSLYLRLKLMQPEARHIVCVYSIQHERPFNAMDYQDDGEPGAGRAIMELFNMNNIQGKAVFVARKYGGIKMGSSRFQCYLQAAKAALELDMGIVNLVTKQEQKFKGSAKTSGSHQLQESLDRTRQAFETDEHSTYLKQPPRPQRDPKPKEHRYGNSVRGAKSYAYRNPGYSHQRGRGQNYRQQRGYTKGSRNFMGSRRGGYTESRPGSAIIQPIAEEMDYQFSNPITNQRRDWSEQD